VNSTRVTLAAAALLDAVSESMPAEYRARIEAGDVVMEVERSWWRSTVRVRLAAQDQKSPRRRFAFFG
jgi:hypothetical protein